MPPPGRARPARRDPRRRGDLPPAGAHRAGPGRAQRPRPARRAEHLGAGLPRPVPGPACRRRGAAARPGPRRSRAGAHGGRGAVGADVRGGGGAHRGGRRGTGRLRHVRALGAQHQQPRQPGPGRPLPGPAQRGRPGRGALPRRPRTTRRGRSRVRARPHRAALRLPAAPPAPPHPGPHRAAQRPGVVRAPARRPLGPLDPRRAARHRRIRAPPRRGRRRRADPQQRQIARHAAQGATNREIAEQLFLSPRTVEHHLGNIFAKLGIRSRVELTKLLP
ncbi:helix-turn-helix transcriptional regulator [Catellatospora bangladeshensis]|uniref:helix-turn-helix domain-containing protein n=1 Tax=Catellatospora bangladeshensis TaxID=310355 RepID=UPI00361F7E84